jgi:hypothetical protein
MEPCILLHGQALHWGVAICNSAGNLHLTNVRNVRNISYITYSLKNFFKKHVPIKNDMFLVIHMFDSQSHNFALGNSNSLLYLSYITRSMIIEHYNNQTMQLWAIVCMDKWIQAHLEVFNILPHGEGQCNLS